MRMTMKKFMMVLARPKYRELTRIAQQRGIDIQMLIRSEIVPGWLRHNDGLEGTIDIDKLIHLIERYKPLNGKHARKAKAVTKTRRQR